MSIWDDPELRAGGEFVKLENQGDYVSGTIQAIRKHRFDDGSTAPQVLLVTDEGEERTLTAGQVKLKNELAVQRPEAGDWIRVTLTQIEKRAGGKTLKHFSVELRRGNGAPPAPAAAAAAPQQYAAPAPVPAAPAQQYAAPAPAAAPYAPPALAPAPVPQPVGAAPAAVAPQLSPEQQAAIAALSPEQRQALGWA